MIHHWEIGRLGDGRLEKGKAKLVATQPGEAGPLCTFRTVAGNAFRLPRPPISAEEERAVKVMLRQILEGEET